MRIAVVGVTGMVGKVMLDVLTERNIPISELIPVASEKSIGKTKNCIVKILYSRGLSDHGYGYDGYIQPRLYLIRKRNIQTKPRCFISLGFSEYKLRNNAHLAKIKHLNRLEQILGFNNIGRGNYDNYILLDERERIIECISSNIFFYKLKKDDYTKFLLYFLGKLFIELGIFPDLSLCQITGAELNRQSNISLRADLGGFVLNSELEDSSLQKDAHYLLRLLLDQSASTKWSEQKWQTFDSAPKHLFHDLMEYLSFQLNINLKKNLKSYGSLGI